MRYVRRHTVNLKHDAARLDAARPIFRRTLTFTHANLGRFLGDRHIRENANPYATGTFHVPRDNPTRSLNLTRRNALR